MTLDEVVQVHFRACQFEAEVFVVLAEQAGTAAEQDGDFGDDDFVNEIVVQKAPDRVAAGLRQGSMGDVSDATRR